MTTRANLLHADYLTRRSFYSVSTGVETKGSLGGGIRVSFTRQGCRPVQGAGSYVW
jgi:hypothetical protein